VTQEGTGLDSLYETEEERRGEPIAEVSIS
jgi:hypothetical protein